MNPNLVDVKRGLITSSLVLLFASITNVAYADTLKEIFEQAWTNSIQGRTVQAKQGEVAASRAVAGAIFPGSPQLGFSHRNDFLIDNRGAQENEIGVSVPLWLPGQKAARQSVAEAEGKESQLTIEAQRLAVAGELRTALWTLYVANSEAEIAAERLATAEKLESEVAKRLKAGDVARTDLLLARQETTSAHAAVAEEKSRIVQSMQRYKVLTGSEKLPDNPREAVKVAADGAPHPRLAAARAVSELAYSGLNLAQASRRDAPTIGMLYRNERDASSDNSRNTIGLAVTVPLSSNVRNAPLIAKANTSLIEAEAQDQRVLAEIEADERATEAQLESAQVGAELSVEREQAASERLALIRRSFELGETSLVELIRAQTQATEARIAQVRSDALLSASQANLNQARGLTP